MRCSTYGLTAVTMWVGVLGLADTAQASERLKGIACRSVHLGYTAPQCDVFYNEITVEQTAEGTYFCVCGFNKGYFGVQELRNNRKVIIFSVWDPGQQNDPGQVEQDRRVHMLYKDPAVRTGRFGNEGTGGQSFFDYDWKVGETYRFMVKSKIDGQRTEFSAYFFVPQDKQWKHLVTFSTITQGRPISGQYSFVEDFRRNRVSTEQTRRARFGNGWARDLEGNWRSLNRARFTADRNPVVNINAGRSEDRFFLATGGDIENTDTPLWRHIELPENLKAKAPEDVLTLLAQSPSAEPEKAKDENSESVKSDESVNK